MRIAAAALLAGATVMAPVAASAQDVIVREPADTQVIVREPAERRVIVREPAEERVIVRRAPDVVRRYVVEESRPSIAYERKIVVGDTLPTEVEAYSVPESDYRYVVLNQRRYIVDGDRRVIDVVD